MVQAPPQPAAILPATQTDPLANLRDIHLPLPIEQWPPAPGWWVLVFFGMAAVLAALYWLWSHWKANTYRRDGVRQLDEIMLTYESHGDVTRYLEEFQVLLKRVALTRYDRQLVASLSGEEWVAFLDRSSNSLEFSMGAGQVLITGNYEPEPTADVQQLNKLGRFWIQKHHDLPALEQALVEQRHATVGQAA